MCYFLSVNESPFIHRVIIAMISELPSFQNAFVELRDIFFKLILYFFSLAGVPCSYPYLKSFCQ